MQLVVGKEFSGYFEITSCITCLLRGLHYPSLKYVECIREGVRLSSLSERRQMQVGKEGRRQMLVDLIILYIDCSYGQFDMAKETFEVVFDYESMLDFFICHLNPSALRRLVQKLEKEGSNPELQRQCEKVLSVRSAGWGQGVFANFAAESMVPKGVEWAGGNWELRTQSDGKKSSEWELSSEVTAYMKTPSGPIPTITPDHIGVYLGTLRGRGTVVEVREDMLVRFGKLHVKWSPTVCKSLLLWSLLRIRFPLASY